MTVIDWLLDSDPSIRWQVMRDLTHEPADVIAADRSRIATEAWGARLLALQAPDGQWGDRPWSHDWTDTFHVLEPIGGGHMSRDGEERLTSWMREHLMVSVVAYPDRTRLDAFETVVLERLDPPLNLAKRPVTPVRLELSALRRPFSRRVVGTARRIERPRQPSAPSGSGGELGLTPEDLARTLGLPNAKRIQAFLRARFPRPTSELGTQWGSLTPEMERAVRDRFRADR